jgi:hypothetical protein
MPVVRGSDFKIDFTPTNNAPKCEVYWIPMGPSHHMLSLQHLEVNQINPSDTNGVLMGYAQTDNGVAWLNLEVSETEDFKAPIILNRTTVQNRRDRIVPYNSATAVVPKGAYFRASYASESGSPGKTCVSWVGIEAR